MKDVHCEAAGTAMSRVHLLLAVWSACAVGSPAAQAADEASKVKVDPLVTLANAGANVRKLEAERLDRLKAEQQACADLAAKDRALADHLGGEMAKARELAQAALDAHDACEAARRRRPDADGVLQAARAVLRFVASDLGECGQPDKPCHAEALAPSVSSLAYVLDHKGSVLQSDKVVQNLIEAASEAQQRVVATKATVADGFAIGDRVARQALSSHATDPTSRGGELRTAGRRAFESAFELRAAAASAQRASNDLVGEAMALNQPCDVTRRGPEGCRNATVQPRAAAEALTRLEAGLTTAAAALDKVKEGGFQSDAATAHEDLAARRRAAEFARLLDKYPDSKSVIGAENYAKLSAASDGAAASIKFGVGRLLPAGWRETALIVSTPEKLGNDRLLSSADGLAGSTTIELSHTFGKGLDTVNKVLGFDTLYVTGVSLKGGWETLSRIDGADLGKRIDERFATWGASAYAALYRLTAKNPNVHLFKLELQRGVQAGEPEFRCSTPTAGDTSVTCANGAFTAPKREYSRLYTYEWRFKAGGFAASPSFSYNDVSRLKELKIPMFLIRGDGEKSAFNAGINFHWTNKVGGSLGVFVGTPFSLYALDR